MVKAINGLLVNSGHKQIAIERMIGEKPAEVVLDPSQVKAWTEEVGRGRKVSPELLRAYWGLDPNRPIERMISSKRIPLPDIQLNPEQLKAWAAKVAKELPKP